jgi:flavin reductase (DIM6/NTAB) family NADH-FMN oxidoreductase RutF|tara:strand:- start:378 stop:866 length:489 start_codon:yes stop_codon:yes gene_type:complete
MDGPAIDPTILLRMPQHPFLLTSFAGEARTGLVTTWAQQCSKSPLLVMVAIERGTEIEPLIRDTRAFALTSLNPNDRLIPRRFNPPPPHNEDPFVGMRLLSAITGCPILKRGQYWLDCELVGHLAPDASHRIYIGQVLASGLGEATSTADAAQQLAAMAESN